MRVFTRVAIFLLQYLLAGSLFGQIDSTAVVSKNQVVNSSIEVNAMLERSKGLQDKLEYSEFIISALNTSLTIVAVLFGIILPLATYVLVIKPQKELQKTLNNKIKKYLEKARSESVKQSLDILNSLDSSDAKKRIAISTISDRLTNDKRKRYELYRLIEAIEHEPSAGLQQDIHHLLIYTNHQVVERFYIKELVSPRTEQGGHYAIVYFNNFPENAITAVRSTLLKTPSRYGFLKEFVDKILDLRNKELALNLINDKVAIDLVSPQLDSATATKWKNEFETKWQHLKITKHEIQQSYLFSKYSEAASRTIP